MQADPVAIAQSLIRCRSVTPAEGGALRFLERLFKDAGFEAHRVTFDAPGTPSVENLFAKIGSGAPHLAFAGHTDVVPPGEEARWKHGAFSGDVKDGVLYGRGAVDMKGGIAAFAGAALDYAKANKGKPKGTISFLITGDEEGPGVNGTVKLLAWAKERGEVFDHCIVGEPTSVTTLGDTIKIGRRGSLSGTLTIAGKAGHVAYPHHADNPIRALIAILNKLQEPLDDGSWHFDRSNFEVVSVDVGNAAFNVIPGEAKAKFNVRFNDKHTPQSLKELIKLRAREAAPTAQVKFDWEPASDSFITQPGPFVDLIAGAIADVTGKKPALTTGGGTSDARFVKDYCPVVDFGLVGQTMHQIDEHVPVADLQQLAKIYGRALERYFS
ncbi:MAG TPA: succinyl-diaminopimelate desuccinylase [Xanthobacteraceae bacterium]|nr:succinyl-diaminopimelate desuccinylase [Xanthobacteraceae bacterium]